jgi:HK97 family phage major capsid protein
MLKMKASNRSIVEKADLAISDLTSCGGYLNPMQANTFIRMMQEQPTLISQIRTVPMNSPTMQINKIGFADRILNAAPSSGSYLKSADRAKPSTEQVNLKTHEVIAEVHIPYDVIEDNIERGKLEDTIMALIAERASLDLEELIIEGDTTSGDDYLALTDGILVLAYRHLCDFTGQPGANIIRSTFKDMMKCMPNKYLRNRAAMRHFVSPHAAIEYADSLAGRETALGDSKNIGWAQEKAFGIPVEAVALMPNAYAILTYPKNIIWGVQRQIMIETDRDIRARVLIVVLTLRIDIQFEEDDAVVKATGLDPDADMTCTEVPQTSCVTGPCAASISC